MHNCLPIFIFTNIYLSLVCIKLMAGKKILESMVKYINLKYTFSCGVEATRVKFSSGHVILMA